MKIEDLMVDCLQMPDWFFKKPTIPDVIGRFRDYYAKPENSVGGSLHIVLDDGNVEDSSVEHCIKRAEETGDTEGVALGEILLRMSRTQRRKLGRHPNLRPNYASPIPGR